MLKLRHKVGRYVINRITFDKATLASNDSSIEIDRIGNERHRELDYKNFSRGTRTPQQNLQLTDFVMRLGSGGNKNFANLRKGYK